jgi:tRNA(Ile2) C34 agmatinyltransferase TiaS
MPKRTKKQRKRAKIEHARRMRQAAATGPKCPACGRKTTPQPDGLFACPGCLYITDDPDEGGDYYNDPTKRIEKHGW